MNSTTTARDLIHLKEMCGGKKKKKKISNWLNPKHLKKLKSKFN